jgi:hypothetical protein
VAISLTVALAGCPTPASILTAPPKFEPKHEALCSVGASRSEPLIVEWPSASRAKLEAVSRAGLVAVRYQGCEMEVLGQCTGPGHYGYLPVTRKHDQVVVRDTDSLYANLPTGAMKLEGTLQRAGELHVDMTIVGRWQADRPTVGRGDLTGDCGRATHVVTAITAGAFKFFAGADAQLGANAAVFAKGQSASARQSLAEDGDESACAGAAPDDRVPPFGCGAPIRVEVVPVVEGKAPPVATVAPPACPPGATWDGRQCAATAVACPSGFAWNGAACVSAGAAEALPPHVGFWCYRLEFAKQTPKSATFCHDAHAKCKWALEEDRHTGKEGGRLASSTDCFPAKQASCFTHNKQTYCYLQAEECAAVARVWGSEEGCVTRAAERW